MLPERFPAGTNVAVEPLTLTVPLTTAPPVTRNVKLAVLTVEFVIASENTAEIEVFKGTPAEPIAGDPAKTVGGVVSGRAAVTKFQAKSDGIALPAASATPLAMVTTYSLLGSRANRGVNLAVFPIKTIVPSIIDPVADETTVKLPALTVELVIASENVAEIEVFTATPIEALEGKVEDTAGGVASVAVPVVKNHVKFVARTLFAASFATVVTVAVY